MKELMKNLSGNKIRVEQSGDVGCSGILFNVQDDYASLLSNEQQVIHYPYQHIKSVTTNVTEGPVMAEPPQSENAESFQALLAALVGKMVRIEIGEGACQGVLSTADADTVSMVVQTKDRTYYPISQIKNISPIYRITTTKSAESSKDTDSDTNQGQQQEEQEAKTSSDQDSRKRSNADRRGRDSKDSKEANEAKIFNRNLAQAMLDRLSVSSTNSKQKASKNITRSRTSKGKGSQTDDRPLLVTMKIPSLRSRRASTQKSHR